MSTPLALLVWFALVCVGLAVLAWRPRWRKPRWHQSQMIPAHSAVEAAEIVLCLGEFQAVKVRPGLIRGWWEVAEIEDKAEGGGRKAEGGRTGNRNAPPPGPKPTPPPPPPPKRR